MNCDETIESSFPIHFQFAFKLPPEVDWLNSVSIRIGSMRIPCGRDQFELIRIQCALFSSCRQASSHILQYGNTYIAIHTKAIHNMVLTCIVVSLSFLQKLGTIFTHCIELSTLNPQMFSPCINTWYAISYTNVKLIHLISEEFTRCERISHSSIFT